jgi:hypothetical protein
MKKVLFIDVDGVLNTYSDEIGITWREERDLFLDWAATLFECRFLTAWNATELKEEFPSKWHFPVEDWLHNKAEAIWRLPKDRTWAFLDDDPWDLSNTHPGEFILIDGEKVGELRRVMAILKP